MVFCCHEAANLTYFSFELQSSRKWARVNKRSSNFDKENKTDGRRKRIEDMKQAKIDKKPFHYSWEAGDDEDLGKLMKMKMVVRSMMIQMMMMMTRKMRMTTITTTKNTMKNDKVNNDDNDDMRKTKMP